MDGPIHKYLELLWRMFETDIEQLSQPWMYYWLLVPAIGYLIFFFLKWSVLTAPIWLPFSIIVRSLKDVRKK